MNVVGLTVSAKSCSGRPMKTSPRTSTRSPALRAPKLLPCKVLEFPAFFAVFLGSIFWQRSYLPQFLCITRCSTTVTLINFSVDSVLLLHARHRPIRDSWARGVDDKQRRHNGCAEEVRCVKCEAAMARYLQGGIVHALCKFEHPTAWRLVQKVVKQVRRVQHAHVLALWALDTDMRRPIMKHAFRNGQMHQTGLFLGQGCF